MESARPASAGDVAVVASLLRAAVQEATEKKGGPMWARLHDRTEPFEDAFAAAIADPDEHVVVGTIDGVVIGFAAARSHAVDGDVVVIRELFVLPDARGVGVGEAVLDEVLAWAGARGSIAVDSLALPGDRHTKNFFETFGLVARGIVVHRPL